MTDEAPICPHCGAPVSHFTHYIFVPSENRRWHAQCWDIERKENGERGGAEVVG